jgi:hypothetical protein
MGLGQTMLMVMFLALTMIMIVNALSNMNNADVQILTAEAYKTASDLGQSLMAEIVNRRFDQKFDTTSTTVQGPTTYPAGFSSNLSPDGPAEHITLPDVSPYQSMSKYNDVDDYDGYSRITDSTNGLGRFRDSVIVYYVQMGTSTTPPTYSSSQTWFKKIEVWVTSDNWLKKGDANIWVKRSTIVTAFKEG